MLHKNTCLTITEVETNNFYIQCLNRELKHVNKDLIEVVNKVNERSHTHSFQALYVGCKMERWNFVDVLLSTSCNNWVKKTCFRLVNHDAQNTCCQKCWWSWKNIMLIKHRPVSLQYQDHDLHHFPVYPSSSASLIALLRMVATVHGWSVKNTGLVVLHFKNRI